MIYLDANVIIRLIESEPIVPNPVSVRIMPLMGIPDVFLTSILSRLECRVKPIKLGDTATLALYDGFFRAAETKTAKITAAIIEKATQIRAVYNLKTPDAIHYATAILGGATTFLTGDKQLARATEVPVEVL